MKIAVFGVGHLGKIHLKCLQQTDWNIVGIYDPDSAAAQEAATTYGVKLYHDAAQLIASVDAVDIVSTTMSHYEVACMAIAAGKHIFVEKPLAHQLSHAADIVAKAKEANVLVQVGHVERYNPAMIAIAGRGLRPKFVEGHRLTTFNTRGNDVSVVYDLMIHDLDLVLSMIDSKVSEVYANGVCVVNDTPDICNARIIFENGAVANLTASRISMKNMRKLRVFQENEYVSIDLLKKESQIISLTAADDSAEGLTILTSSGKKLVNMEVPQVVENNAIVAELSEFYDCIVNQVQPAVNGQAGYDAMLLADQIDKAVTMASRV